MKPVVCWGLQWRSQSMLDGWREHLVRASCLPLLFRTRREARAYVDRYFGYIQERPDLRGQPHGWRFPKVIRVKVEPL